MKAYQKQQEYIYCHCQPVWHVAPSQDMCSTLVLPILGLAGKHEQKITMYHMNHINQWHVHPPHMTFSHTHLLPVFNNVSNTRCSSCTSSHSGVHRASLSLGLNLPSGLERKVVEILLALLLLISGDIETNPGPVSEFSLVLCKTVHHTDVMSHSPCTCRSEAER